MGTLGIIAIVLLAIGVIFSIIEAFVPGFGFFGIVGILSFIAGTVLFILDGASALLIFLLILGFALLLAFVVLFIVESAKFGVMSKSALSETRTAIPTDYSDERKNPFQVLMGKEGVVTRDCRPVGKAMFAGSEQEVISLDTMLESGTRIKVHRIEGNKVFVRKV